MIRFFLARLSFLACASSLALADLSQPELRSGDLVLLSMGCHLCHLIESETSSPYSHLGIVWVDAEGRSWVFHSLGEKGVHRTPYTEFIQYARRGSVPTIRRWQGKSRWTEMDPARLEEEFRTHFENHPYDPKFLWNNTHQTEESESFYCSEMIAKLLVKVIPVLSPELAPRPMIYDKERAGWIAYFGETPPDGLPGLAPAHFAVSSLWSDPSSTTENTSCLIGFGDSFGRLGRSYPTPLESFVGNWNSTLPSRRR